MFVPVTFYMFLSTTVRPCPFLHMSLSVLSVSAYCYEYLFLWGPVCFSLLQSVSIFLCLCSIRLQLLYRSLIKLHFLCDCPLSEYLFMFAPFTLSVCLHTAACPCLQVMSNSQLFPCAFPYSLLCFLALYSKNLKATLTWNFMTYPNFLRRMPLWKK